MTTRLVPAAYAVTLGILAGGEASRLGGRDKAWLERDGTPQVLSLTQGLGPLVESVLVSANRNAERYLAHGLRVLHDRVPGLGPIGGLDVLATECRSAWLLTLPVDVVDVPVDLVDRLLAAAGDVGACVEDDDGRQPLAAVWAVAPLRVAVADAIGSGNHAMHALQTQLGMEVVRFPGVRLGNLNTPDDLAAAGIALP